MKNILYRLLVSAVCFIIPSSLPAQLRTSSPTAQYCQVRSFKSGIQPVVEHGAASTFYYLEKSPDRPYPEYQRWTKMIWVQPKGEVISHENEFTEQGIVLKQGVGHKKKSKAKWGLFIIVLIVIVFAVKYYKKKDKK